MTNINFNSEEIYNDKHLIIIQETLNSLSIEEKKELLNQLTIEPANNRQEYTENVYKEELIKWLKTKTK